MVNAVQNLGVLFALPFAPYVSDKFGRKKALMTGSWIMLGGVALQTASTNIWHFVGSRGMSKLPMDFATADHFLTLHTPSWIWAVLRNQRRTIADHRVGLSHPAWSHHSDVSLLVSPL